MTEVERLAQFVFRAEFKDLSPDALTRLKCAVLDTLGVAIGALDAAPIRAIRAQLEEFGGNPLASCIGGGETAPDRAAFYNGALVRYLDFMDSYIAPQETFHPSDNLASVLAAAEYANATGKEFLTALAVAYQVHIRLSEEAPVRAKGFDHTTQGAYAAAAGVSKVLRLDSPKIAHAISMSGTSNNALRVTRTGALSNWKGLAYPQISFSATHLAFLAMHGITGPLEVFEGNKGFVQTIAGPFKINWKAENLEGVRRSILKKYNAEIHSQSAIEGVLDLKDKYHFSGNDIRQINIEIFQVAFDIIGGGEEGDKTRISNKEEADHSLPYLLAVALLDGELYPRQYSEDRIRRHDVQSLLRLVHVKPCTELTARFPNELPVRIELILKNGDVHRLEKSDYEGFHTRPMEWKQVIHKFRILTKNFTALSVQNSLIETVSRLEEFEIRELTRLLSELDPRMGQVAS